MAAFVRSPCKGICKFKDKEVCIGCYRTRFERYRWNDLSEEYKFSVLTEIEARRLVYGPLQVEEAQEPSK